MTDLSESACDGYVTVRLPADLDAFVEDGHCCQTNEGIYTALRRLFDTLAYYIPVDSTYSSAESVVSSVSNEHH